MMTAGKISSDYEQRVILYQHLMNVADEYLCGMLFAEDPDGDPIEGIRPLPDGAVVISVLEAVYDGSEHPFMGNHMHGRLSA